MKLGLFGLNMGAGADPDVARVIAVAAESAGIESLWMGEHVVLPDPQVPPSPVPPEAPMLDPVVALTHLAAITKTIRLGTGILILPQRNPLVLAKELASLDVVSKGRLLVGLGIGYLKAEFDAIGVPFDRKGARTEDALAAMRAIWTMEKPEHSGPFHSFAGVQARPRPVAPKGPPIVFGGHTPEAFDRAARLADGWFGFSVDVEATRECLAGLRAACAKHGRRFEDLEVSVTPGKRKGASRTLQTEIDRETVERFGEIGVDRLIVYPAASRDEASLRRSIDSMVAAAPPG